MSDIVCNFNGTFYSVRIEYCGEVFCKVDTGAANTIMNIDLFHALVGGSKRKLIEFLTKSNVKKAVFKSYSGNKFDAILCKLRNVKIQDILIPEFYFYVTLEPVNAYGLLGMDFLKCCKICGSPYSNLILNMTDYKEYNDSDFIELDDLIVNENSSSILLQGAEIIQKIL